MAITVDNILSNAKTISNYMLKNKFKYAFSGNGSSWSYAKGHKTSNCSTFVSFVCQQAGLLKTGQMFYGWTNGTLKCQGNGTLTRINKYFNKIKVGGKKVKNLKSTLKKGDIVLCNKHTALFAGFNKNGDAVFYDAGRPSTNTGKIGGRFVKIYQIKNNQQAIYYILRLKNQPTATTTSVKSTKAKGKTKKTYTGKLCNPKNVYKKKQAKKGYKGINVGRYQAFLEWYYNIKPKTLFNNNYFGNNTEKYVKKFQKENGLKADGYINEKTYKAMKNAKK